MKKFLSFCMICALIGLLCPMVAEAAVTDPNATRAEEYDYSKFYLCVGNPNPLSYPTEAVEGSTVDFVAKHVPMRNDDLVSVQSMEYGLLLACVGETIITEDNPTCQMVSLAMGATNYGVSRLFGYYDVTLKFSGQTVTLSFVKVEDIEVDYTKMTFSIQGGFNAAPTEKADKKLVFKTLPLIGKRNFLFQNSVDGSMYAWKEIMPAITNSNPSTTIYKDPEEYATFDFTDGLYDVTLDYNDDYTAATVSFAKAAVPEEIATYTGDLYMFGEFSQGIIATPEYKFTCLQPGLYEWKGEVIDTEFRIMGTDQVIPGTSYKPIFGAPMYTDIAPLTTDTESLIQMNGLFFNLPDAMYEIQNPVVTLDLRTLTIKVTGDYTRHNINLEDLRFITSDYNSTAPTSVTGNVVEFQNIDLTNINGFVLDYRNKISFANSSSEGPIVSEDNLEVTLDAQPSNQSYFVSTDLNGPYTVSVSLNDTQTVATVKFIKYDPSAVIGIGDSESAVQLTRFASGITIENLAEGAEIAVYSIDGSIIGRYTATGEKMNIGLPQKGIYIVRTGNSTFKVNL